MLVCFSQYQWPTCICTAFIKLGHPLNAKPKEHCTMGAFKHYQTRNEGSPDEEATCYGAVSLQCSPPPKMMLHTPNLHNAAMSNNWRRGEGGGGRGRKTMFPKEMSCK